VPCLRLCEADGLRAHIYPSPCRFAFCRAPPSTVSPSSPSRSLLPSDRTLRVATVYNLTSPFLCATRPSSYFYLAPLPTSTAQWHPPALLRYVTSHISHNLLIRADLRSLQHSFPTQAIFLLLPCRCPDELANLDLPGRPLSLFSRPDSPSQAQRAPSARGVFLGAGHH